MHGQFHTEYCGSQQIFSFDRSYKLHITWDCPSATSLFAPGDLLQGTISCSKNKKDPRALEIVLRGEHSSFLPDVKPTRIEQKYSLY